MPRKTKFIINRHTWFLDQFEFSVPCSYQDCLARMQVLKTYLRTERPNRNGFRPILKLESVDDSSSSFEMVFTNVIVTGTLQKISDQTTRFVGISQFEWDYPRPITLNVIIVVLAIVGAVVIIFPFLSAYVLADPSRSWSINTVNTALPEIKIALTGIVFFYLLLRWQVWRAVDKLVSAVDY